MTEAEVINRFTLCLDCTDCLTCADHDKAIEATIKRLDDEKKHTCQYCTHHMFSDSYGECKRGYLGGIIRPNDYCSRGDWED